MHFFEKKLHFSKHRLNGYDKKYAQFGIAERPGNNGP